MAEKACYYEVLRVERSATKSEIDRAYRKLAIKYHPDSNRDDEDAIEKFKEATEAYEVLSDREKRERYDRYGHSGVDGVHQFNDVEDIFEAFGGIFLAAACSATCLEVPAVVRDDDIVVARTFVAM